MPKYNYEFYCRIIKEDFLVIQGNRRKILSIFIITNKIQLLDIGAHIGDHTIIASKRVGANGKVFAIETYPGNLKC